MNKWVLSRAIYLFLEPTVTDIQSTVTYVDEKQQILTFKKLERDNFCYFCLKNDEQLTEYLQINFLYID